MITDEQIKQGLDNAYREAGHNTYFGNGFEAGVKFVLKQVKNIAYEPVLTPVLPKWDCDDCKHYPCTHQEIVGKEKKLRYNQCGDHSERGTP